MVSSKSRRHVVALTVFALLAMLTVMWVPQAQAATAGGFEIDGDIVASTDLDWSNVTGQPVWSDGVNNPDNTIFFNGSKENDPAAWQVHGSGQPPDKDDIGYAFGYAHRTGGHEWADLGFERVGANGTTLFTVELNQKTNKANTHGVSIPDRSEGDLRITIIQQGNETFSVAGTVDQFQSGHYVTLAPPAGSVVGMSNSTAITPLNNSDPIRNNVGKIPAGHFAEVAFDLTAINNLGSQTCRAGAFHVANGRSQSSDAENPELKDYLSPINITIPSDCATLHITKSGPDGETAAPGATFTISPDPRTGSGEAVTVTDGESAGGSNDIADPDGKADGVLDITAEPGHDYTVTETSPPPGYFLGATTEVTQSTSAGSTTNFAFSDPLGSVTFHKTDGESPLPGAKFHVVATSGPAKDTKVDFQVKDNQSGDTAAAAGTITVANMLKGSYSITESAAPTGYQLDDSTKTFTVGPDQENKDVVLESAFVDEPVPTAPELHIAKHNIPTGSVHEGDEITYAVTWWNTGTADAVDQTVTDELPADVEYVDSTGATFDAAAGPSGTLSASPASIALGTTALDPAGSFTVTVKVRPGTVGHTITNTAYLGQLHSSVSNDVIATPQVPTGSMKLVKSVSPILTKETATTLTYTLVATAEGDLDQHKTVISDV